MTPSLTIVWKMAVDVSVLVVSVTLPERFGATTVIDGTLTRIPSRCSRTSSASQAGGAVASPRPDRDRGGQRVAAVIRTILD